MVPLPFSRIFVDIETPLALPSEATRENVDALCLEIEDGLHRMHREWFAKLGRPAIPELVRWGPR